MKPVDNARQIILDMKIANVIKTYSEVYEVSLEEAADLYYSSVTAQMIEEGTSDLHCMSEKYLVEELWREVNESKN